jgi:hypothetical protein
MRRNYHLRLEALRVAERNAGTLQDFVREEMKAFLSTLHSNHLGLSSAIVEALLAYGMVQSPVTADEVAHELTEILAIPDDSVAELRAYRAISNIFEDVFQGAYWDAIERLSSAERVQLLTMAAMGAPPYGCSIDWIIAELLKAGDEKSLPAFVLWSLGINPRCGSHQDATRTFLLAVIGCAQFLREPLPFVKLETDAERAWETYGAILFWIHKPGLTLEETRAKCASLWNRLRTELAFEAVDPLFYMGQFAYRKSPFDEGDLFRELCAKFSEDVRFILEFSLKNRGRLTSIFGQFRFAEDIPAFIIRSLGAVGNRHTIRLLEQFVDSPDLGSLSVDVIRKLNAATESF